MSTLISLGFFTVAALAYSESKLTAILFAVLGAVNYLHGNHLEAKIEAQGAPQDVWGCAANAMGVVVLVMLALFIMAGLGVLG